MSKLYNLIEMIAANASEEELDREFPLSVCDADSLAPVIGARCENVLTAYYDTWKAVACIRKVAKQVVSGELTEDQFYDWLVKGGISPLYFSNLAYLLSKILHQLLSKILNHNNNKLR